MTWEAFLLLLNLNAKVYCDSLFIQESNCVESVVECVLDGESFEFCTGASYEIR